VDTEREPDHPQSGKDDVAASALGWHRIQLAVLGFIGLCGVLQGGAELEPRWLEQVAGSLAISALVVACVAVYMVGRVAWPLSWPAVGHQPGEAAKAAANRARTLRFGVALTYLATVAIALAALSNWWPENASGEASGAGLVQVSGPGGQSWCGQMVDAPAGSLRIVTDRGAVDLAGGTIAGIVSVDSCWPSGFRVKPVGSLCRDAYVIVD
jgi:hypothetical protein